MRRIGAGTAVLLVALLGGCSEGSVARDTYRGLPPGVEVEGPVLSPEPMLTWLEDGAAFAITTWGSSSCPPVAVETESDRQSVTVVFEDSDNDACTADLGPTSHEFDVTDSVADDPSVSARFRSGTTERTYSLTSP
ncbi:hypothetical protein [Aeromicrobium sp. Sec7.5]|uniref:hypothetical protein n=1 Tax=Aeromicrobium sp. Sec7.5 TaxID=3121276 RepID=UPI002FE4AAAC